MMRGYAHLKSAVRQLAQCALHAFVSVELGPSFHGESPDSNPPRLNKGALLSSAYSDRPVASTGPRPAQPSCRSSPHGCPPTPPPKAVAETYTSHLSGDSRFGTTEAAGTSEGPRRPHSSVRLSPEARRGAQVAAHAREHASTEAFLRPSRLYQGLTFRPNPRSCLARVAITSTPMPLAPVLTECDRSRSSRGTPVDTARQSGHRRGLLVVDPRRRAVGLFRFDGHPRLRSVRRIFEPFGTRGCVLGMGRGDLTNAEWARLKPNLQRGGRWASHRRVINGISSASGRASRGGIYLRVSGHESPSTSGRHVGQGPADSPGRSRRRGPDRLEHGERGLDLLPRSSTTLPLPITHPVPRENPGSGR